MGPAVSTLGLNEALTLPTTTISPLGCSAMAFAEYFVTGSISPGPDRRGEGDQCRREPQRLVGGQADLLIIEPQLHGTDFTVPDLDRGTVSLSVGSRCTSFGHVHLRPQTCSSAL
jgi:hypothetical protein